MAKKYQIKTMKVKDLKNPWGGDERIKDEVNNAFERFSENPKPFSCIKCGEIFKPQPHQWIFYDLCDICFKEFDKQKMEGRYAMIDGKIKTCNHFENANEWIKSLNKK